MKKSEAKIEFFFRGSWGGEKGEWETEWTLSLED